MDAPKAGEGDTTEVDAVAQDESARTDAAVDACV